MKIGHYIICLSGLADRHHFGSGFAVYENIEPYIKEFNPVSERMAILRFNTKPLNIVLMCVQFAHPN